MKKLIYLLCISIAFISCENANDVNTEIGRLKEERKNLKNSVQDLRSAKSNESTTLTSITKQITEKRKLLGIYNAGKQPVYILKFQLKQSHFSLDIGKHMKDAMNKIKFELPVSEEFYNSVAIGTDIVDEFRMGSFLLYGSIGDWDMTITDKEIR